MTSLCLRVLLACAQGRALYNANIGWSVSKDVVTSAAGWAG
jgi:hypothetical protein